MSKTVIDIIEIKNDSHLKIAFDIRKKVFVEEQKVDENEEYDDFENISTHFLAFYNGNPAGTARWRFTEKGIKLERFAVLKEYRGKNIGSELVKTTLISIQNNKMTKGKLRYLHAQLNAVPLYEKFGFVIQGDIFIECNIKHYNMYLLPSE